MRYMLITFYRQPNGDTTERVQLSQTLKRSDHQMVSCILDFRHKKVIKCIAFGEKVDTTWDNLYGYYLDLYPSIVTRLDKENSSPLILEQ